MFSTLTDKPGKTNPVRFQIHAHNIRRKNPRDTGHSHSGFSVSYGDHATISCECQRFSLPIYAKYAKSVYTKSGAPTALIYVLCRFFVLSSLVVRGCKTVQGARFLRRRKAMLSIFRAFYASPFIPSLWHPPPSHRCNGMQCNFAPPYVARGSADPPRIRHDFPHQ